MQKTIKTNGYKLFICALLLICALLSVSFLMLGDSKNAEAVTRYRLTIHYYIAGPETSIAPSYSDMYTAGESYSVISPEVTGYSALTDTVQGNLWADETVIVYYIPNDYTLTFNTNSGAFIADYTPPQNYTYGEEVSLPDSSKISRTGYAFRGWFLYDGVNFADNRGIVSGDIFSLNCDFAFTQTGAEDTEDKTFYARWDLSNYNLCINYFREGTEFPVTDSYIHSYQFGSSYSVNSPAVAGYSALTAKVEGTMDGEGKEINVYYRPNTTTPYKVIHKLQNLLGTTYDTANTDNLTGSTASNTAAAARNYEGYTAQEFLQEVISGEGDTEVIILYSRNSYTLTWDGADGVIPLGIYTQGSVKFGAAITSAQNPSKLGYTFDGWGLEVETTMPAQNVTYTAQWSVVTYDITYILGEGGVNSAANPATYTVESALITLSAPSKGGYTFAGFAEGNTITAGSTGAKTFTAQWSVVTYDITYILGAGGINSAANPATYTVESALITLSAPSKGGYTFAGFAEGNTITAGSTGAKTFTAQWSVITYDITYILGAGGVNSAANPSTYTVESALITLSAPSKGGYTFAGFAEGNTITAGSTGAKTFTAQWTLNAPLISSATGYSGNYDKNEHSLTVTASHVLGSVTYQWYKGSISEENLLEGKTEASLKVKDVADSGEYYCRVTYTDGAQTKYADSGTLVVSIVKAPLSGGIIAVIIIVPLLLIILATYIFLYIIWKKKDKTPLVFLKMSFRKLNNLLFKTELNDAEMIAQVKDK